MPFSGQLWYMTEGGDAETRLVRINDDGTTSTIVNDNGGTGTGDDDFISSFTADVGVDTASGFYFAITNAPAPQNDTAYLVRGTIGGGSAPVIVADFADSLIVNTIEVDAINHKIYVGLQDGTGVNGAVSGIKVYTYDPSTGAITDNGYITTANTDNRGDASGGAKILDPFDFAIDYSTNQMFYTEAVDGLTSGLFRIDLSSPNAAVNMLNNTQFPVNLSNGQIMDVEVDETTDLVYFTTRSRNPSPNANYDANDNALWYISENALAGSNATKVTLTGLPANVYYGGDMAFDQSTRQIYLESSESTPAAADNVIYVFQLNGAGTSAALIRTINPGLTVNNAVIEGLTFVDVAALTVSGTASAMTEQVASATTLLTGAPTITDTDGGYLTGATVQITGGTFNTTDDHIGYSASKVISGTLPGLPNITISWNAATETLTLSGYDTIAHYQTALGGLVYWSTGENPTNYGANTSRTLAWTINDGTPGVLAGSVNSTTTTINIAAVNDAPVNGTVSSATGNENANIAVTGLQVSDVDANAASSIITVTLSVTKGVLTLRDNVASGLVAGDIAGNGSASVTITGTINKINATLAASNGLVFLGNANISGVDTLTVVTNDGGATGSGAQSDTDGYTITIIGANDAPTVSGDGTEVLTSTNEDVTNAGLTNTVLALVGGQYSDNDSDAFAGVAVTANGSGTGAGQWQYFNGSTWVNIGAASTAAAVTIAASAPLRFLPAADFNGPAPTLTVKLVDVSGGALTNGAVVNTTASGGGTPYSTGTVVLSHTVTALNDAPTITGGSTVTLTSVGEDSAPGAGQTVSALFGSHFSDAKDQVPGGSSANAFTGIAVTANAATAAQGVYQYFEGGTWHDLPAVSTASALVLDASTLVRFVPAADYNGTAPALTVSMIEDSSGAVTTGATADLTTTGGSTPYSAFLTLGIVVTPTNDAPIASGSATLTAVNEDTAAPAGQTVSTIFGAHFTDPDGDSLAGVAITGNAVSSQGVWQYFNGAWVNINTPSEGAALVLAAGTLVRFLSAFNFNGAVPALTAYLIDNSGGAVTTGAFLDVSVNGGQTRFSDTSLELTTNITAVNDTPTVPTSATTLGATEQTPALLLGSVTVSDVDLGARNSGNGDYGGASFTVQRASPNAQDTFAFSSGGLFTVSGGDLQVGGLTFAGFTSTGGGLTISFSSSAATATAALVNDVIEHIRYANSSDAPPSSVTLNYALNDGAPGAGQGSGGAASAGGSVIVNITAVNDVHTGGASVTGTAAEDQVLTAVSTIADPDGLGALHYQWQRDVGSGFVNVGTDQSTYTLANADVGGVVRVVISYTDGQAFAESATSTATVVVAPLNFPHTGGVSITGLASEDQVLNANTSTLADADGLGPLHYQWQRDVGSGFVDVGADQATYTLGDADVGGVVRVVVAYIDNNGTAESATSAATGAIANVNDIPTGGISVTGAATENQVLTANTSTLADFDGLGTLHYQWQRDLGSGFVNVGSDQSTYALGDADVGGVARVIVFYVDGQGTTEAKTSAATATVSGVNDPHTGGVSILGLAAEDQVLTAMSSLADVDGLGTLHYQWQRDVGSGFVNIGSDQATYTLGDADVGGVVRVVASYVDGQGFAESATSSSTAAIANLNDPPQALNDVNAVLQRLSASGSVRINDTDPDNATATLVVTNVAFNVTHVDQAVVSGGTVVNGAYGKLTISPDGSYIYLADYEGLVVGQVVTDKFDYTIKDPSSAPSSAQLTITITGSATGDSHANILISDSNPHTLTGRGGADTLTGNGADDIFCYETIGDSTLSAYDTITDFTHDADSLRLTPLMTASTKLTLATDGTDRFLYIDQDGNGTAEGLIRSLGQGLQVSDIATGIANLGFIIIGSEVADTLIGGPGADLILGYGGNDTLFGGGGVDVLNGGSNDDQLTGGAGGDTLNGGDGSDTASYSGALLDVVADLTAPAKNTGDAKGDAYLSIENLLGSDFADVLVGNNSNNVLTGGKGDDRIEAGGDADYIFGGDGNDRLAGQGGNDRIDGGGGNDTMSGGGSGRDWFIFKGAWGNDTITDYEANLDELDFSGGAVTLSQLTFDQNGANAVVTGPGGTITILNTAVTNLILRFAADGPVFKVGTSNSELLNGLGGGEHLFARGGADFINGGGGDDTLVGGAGADTLNGDDGVDTASYSDALAGLRADLTSPATNTGDASGDIYSSIENILGSEFNDFLYGNNGNNVLTGGKGLDNILGGGGGDSLFGGLGNDHLLGQGGNDRLDGGAGNDTLVGGAGGRDWFVFAGVWGSDVVTDFEDNLDLLDLRGLGTSYASLQIVQQSSDVLITLPGMGSILVVDEVKAHITASDFLFG